jgi:Flp pilus assembly pilin Flp
MIDSHKLRRHVKKLGAREDGQDLIEYVLITSFIAVAVAAIFPTTLGPNICTIFSKLVSVLQTP